jgi:hypothetical protein
MQFALWVPRWRSGHDLRQADIGRQRRWLGGLQQGREGLQGGESDGGCRSRFRRTCPSHPHAAHGPLRDGRAVTLPPQATD